MRKRTKYKPIIRLEEAMELLDGFIENPEQFGAWVLLNKIKHKKSGKVPTNINLLDFKINMEKEIRKTARKIERKLGFGLPDGIKD
jgi:hypothetical protein